MYCVLRYHKPLGNKKVNQLKTCHLHTNERRLVYKLSSTLHMYVFDKIRTLKLTEQEAREVEMWTWTVL